MRETGRQHDTDCDSAYLGPRTYANGDCQALAAAISQITGWNVALFEGAGAHVAAVTPDGQYVDIHGTRTESQIRADWDATEPQISSSIDDLGWLGCGTCVCDLRTARDILDREGLLTEDIAEVAAWEIEKLED